PRIRLGDAALDHRAIRLKKLTGGHEAELVEMAEHGQIRGREGSVVHVEVFRQMVSVRTSIIGRPRPSSGDRRAQPPTPSTAKSQILRQWAWSTEIRSDLVRRARIVLWASEGMPPARIAAEVGMTITSVRKWRRRYAQAGLAGLADAARSGRPKQLDRSEERRVGKEGSRGGWRVQE